MNKPSLLEILMRKTSDGYKKFEYTCTPEKDDYGWESAILEARGQGISIKCFGDTFGI